MRAFAFVSVVAGFSVLTPKVAGQVADTDSARSVPYGLSRTYQAIQAERVRLQPVRPDSAEGAAFSDPLLGIGQLVVDETVSRTGSYFYDVFYRLWRPPPDARFVSVALSEQPLPGQGTLIAVRLDGELVFQARLSPREEDAESLARQAVSFTLQRLPRGEG